jgi:hypothetical protein
MKANKYWLLVCFPLVLNVSCNKFLDVLPNDQILQETLFKDADGTRIAVNGVYRLLSTQNLYGNNLTWGMMSAMAQNYEVWALPYKMQDIARFNYASSTAQENLEAVWQKAYNVLANCNNIIQQVENKDSLFFPEKTTEKNMILGEMYGLRAMMHFDLLRIFSPAPVTGYSAETIPYVTTYPTYQPVRLTMPAIFNKITDDLKKAQSLLGHVDTVVLRTVFRNGVGRVRSGSSWIPLPQGDFFNYRAERMNFFAATGLLARVYMYKADYDSAYKYAKFVYDYQKRNWLQWTSSINQGQISDVDYIYTKRPDELLLTFSDANTYLNYENAMNLNGVGSMSFTMNSTYVSELFQGDLDDYRLVGWYNRYNDGRYLTWTKPKGNSYYAEQVLNGQGPLLPVMRFTEMYHILVECNIRQNKIADAVTILNDLRTNRGAKTKIANTVSGPALMEILINDIVRETLTEGQTFYLFKRLNRNIYNGATDRVMQPADWFAPLPQSEVAYQL